MKIVVVRKLEDNEEILVNPKGAEEIEIELSDINSLSSNKELRYIGFGKKEPLYKLSMKSWKTLYKQIGYKFNYSKSRM